jgi:diguanylate cyclase (GGDEF)-like protein
MDTVESLWMRDASPETGRLETLIASLVEVTGQRERAGLEVCFGRAIGRLTSAKLLTIYHLQPEDSDTFVVPAVHLAYGVDVPIADSNIKPFFLSSNAALSARLSKPGTQDLPEGPECFENELILPLRGAKSEITAFCKIENACNDANVQRLLPLLLEIYTNVVSLVEDNERDTLTGLLNRKTFDKRISKILATLKGQNNRAADKAAPVKFCLAALDIDHFKNVNDTFGHVYGDEVLLTFSNLMKKTFRGNDLLFRFGGEEFVVLLADVDIARARTALERFRCVVENNTFPGIGRVTVSIGVALISSDEMPRTTIDRADQALYFSKQNGRNQIRAYEDLVKHGLLKQQVIQAGEIELF